jgi:hypothetical protein
MMKFVKRVKGFEEHDWRHLRWLLRTGIEELFKGNFHEVRESYYWIRIHLSYDSRRVEVDRDDTDKV